MSERAIEIKDPVPMKRALTIIGVWALCFATLVFCYFRFYSR